MVYPPLRFAHNFRHHGMDGYAVSKQALSEWKSMNGERFTTKTWVPGLKSKTILRIKTQGSSKQDEWVTLY